MFVIDFSTVESWYNYFKGIRPNVENEKKVNNGVENYNIWMRCLSNFMLCKVHCDLY